MQSDKPHITDFELKKFFSFFATQKKLSKIPTRCIRLAIKKNFTGLSTIYSVIV